MPAPARTPLILLPAALLLLAVSCTGGAPASPGFAVVKTYGDPRTGELTLRLSRTRVSAAEDLLLELAVRAPESAVVAFPPVRELLSPFGVTEPHGEIRRLAADGTLSVTRSFLLEPFLAGPYAVPPLTVAIRPAGAAAPANIVTAEIPVEVLSVLPPALGDQDIEAPAGPRSVDGDLALWAAFGGLGAGAAFAAAFFLRRQVAARAGLGPRTPWGDALRELERLLSAGPPGAAFMVYYQEVSGIARRYIERRFSVPAVERATEELLQAAKTTAFLSPQSELLGSFLGHCDRVKFGRHEPSGDEAARAAEDCRRLITSTARRTG
jgi:hypothetical protein